MNRGLPPSLLRTFRRLRLVSAGLSVALLVSCGGGSPDEPTNYRSVAMAGELIDYSLDTENLSYSYTITESQFGLAGTTAIGTVIGFDSGGQRGVIVDLKDARAGGLGNGILLGGQQATMMSATTDGPWIAALSSGPWVVFTASGGSIAISQYDGAPADLSVTFTANAPWAGMATTAWGESGFMAESGFYVLQTPAGDLELGVKLP